MILLKLTKIHLPLVEMIFQPGIVRGVGSGDANAHYQMGLYQAMLLWNVDPEHCLFKAALFSLRSKK